MSKSSSIWVITTLAMYQTRFWAEVAQHLQGQGQTVAFLSFDDRSSEYLAKHGFRVYAANAEDSQEAEQLMQDPGPSLEKIGIENLNYWLTHERFAFGLRDSQVMTRRLLTYLALADRCLTEVSASGQPIMLQELGGFISVIASFFAARHHSVDNWFIEPSFFRGRQFFLKNRFSAIEIPGVSIDTVRADVKIYLEEVQDKKTIVVPLKDKHHYSAALTKILNWHNARRLLEKSIDKYLLGKHQEFGHLGNHVARHAGMLYNSMMLKNSYTEVSDLGRFIYYPLHVPGDMALTLRSPQFLDQLGLIDYMLRNIPAGYKLAVKEHPAMMGAVDAGRLKKLLKQYDQLALINPSENNFNVLTKCAAVVSVNSKSGAEAILLNKPVLVLGDAFYRSCNLVIPVPAITDFGTLIKSSLEAESHHNRLDIELYFSQLWECTFPGELYVCGKENTETFTRSLMTVTRP
jgi:hypothetical protein